MTIAELLAVDGLGVSLLSGSEHAGRPIRWAHPIELLQPGRYLRGGELVLTVGSALLSDSACVAFAEDVSGAGAVAIGFGLGDVHAQVPGALLEACLVQGLPLLTIEHGVPFQVLTELIAERRTDVRVAESRLSVRPAGLLFDALAEGRPVEPVLARIAADIGGGLSVVGADGVVEISMGVPGTGHPTVVPLPGERSGRLLWDPPTDSGAGGGATARAMLQELAHPVAVWRRERLAAAEHAERELGRVLALVLDGIAGVSALTDRLEGGGRLSATAWEPAAATRLRMAFPTLPRAELDGRLVVLADDATALRRLAAEHGLACGVVEAVSPEDVAASVREALAALDLSVRRGRPVNARELSTLDALLDQLPPDRLRPFLGQLLAPLDGHDDATGSQLTATLRAYLDGGGAVVPVARKLFLHPNTLRHRLRRIAELTGRSPFDLRGRIAFSIALYVADRQSTTAEWRSAPPVVPGGDQPAG